MIRQCDARISILHELHLTIDRRGVIRRHVATLCADRPEWDAARHRRDAPDSRRDAIDDAIAWLVWRIGGPTLTLGDDYTHPDLLTGRARAIMGGPWAPGLSASEHVAWAWGSEPDPAAWICLAAGVPVGAKSIEVARWCVAQWADHRAAIEPYSARFDELTSADLGRGARATFRRAENRALLESWGGPNELTRPDPRDDAVAGARRLILASDLLRHGQEMRHCVGNGSYIAAVQAGSSQIWSIESVSGHRATAEISGGRVTQIRGPANSAPADECVAIAARIVDAWR